MPVAVLVTTDALWVLVAWESSAGRSSPRRTVGAGGWRVFGGRGGSSAWAAAMELLVRLFLFFDILLSGRLPVEREDGVGRRGGAGKEFGE